MNYIKVRKQFGGILGYILIPPVLIISAILGENIIFYAIGCIFVFGVLFSLIESLVAKCPNCPNKPIPFLGEVPERCQNCDTKFID